VFADETTHPTPQTLIPEPQTRKPMHRATPGGSSALLELRAGPASTRPSHTLFFRKIKESVAILRRPTSNIRVDRRKKKDEIIRPSHTREPAPWPLPSEEGTLGKQIDDFRPKPKNKNGSEFRPGFGICAKLLDSGHENEWSVQEYLAHEKQPPPRTLR